MTYAQRISRAQAIVLPRTAPSPVVEWIVAGLAVLLLLVGLVS